MNAMDQSFQRFLKVVISATWLSILVIMFLLVLYPVSFKAGRIMTVAFVPALIITVLVHLRRLKLLAAVFAGLSLLVGIFFFLPGRAVNSACLRESYLYYLQRYQGCPYQLFGESSKGIDCSGLVRRGLIDANLNIGLATLNLALFRTAFHLWWDKPVSCELITEHDGMLHMVLGARSLNSLTDVPLSIGDVAITADGRHSLAYAGKNTWIEADPYLLTVVEVSTPSRNYWFKQPVCILRWSELDNCLHSVDRNNSSSILADHSREEVVSSEGPLVACRADR